MAIKPLNASEEAGHDNGIEVERALRVLDDALLRFWYPGQFTMNSYPPFGSLNGKYRVEQLLSLGEYGGTASLTRGIVLSHGANL